MATIFSKIVNGDIPSYKIAENNDFYAFLDINPLKKGHTLVIPKQEIDYLFDLEDDFISQMMVFTKKISFAIKSAFPCEKVGMVVLGLEVPHAHIHLVPLENERDIDFSKPKLKLQEKEMQDIAQQIAAYLE